MKIKISNKKFLKKITATLIAFSLTLSSTILTFADENKESKMNPITCILTEDKNPQRDFLKENNGIKGFINGDWALIDLVLHYFNK